MSEIPFSPDIIQTRIVNRTEKLLQEHNIHVSVSGNIPNKGIIVANHPSNWDSIFWRKAVPESHHAVNNLALKKTGIEFIDDQIALRLSRMVPVYSGDSSKRQRTYKYVRGVLDGGGLVVFNPTGKSSCNNTLPVQNEIQVGGLLRLQQVAKINSLYPAYVFVDGEILLNGQVRDGSNVKIVIGDSFQIDQDSEKLKELIHTYWKDLSEKI